MERYLIAALVALVSLGGVFGAGHYRGTRVANLECSAALAESIERASSQARTITLQDASVSASYEAARPGRDIKYRTVEKEVIREIPANCAQCRINPNALGMLNDALAGRPSSTPAPTGEPD